MVQFDPYQGENSGKQIASKIRWRLSDMVLFNLMESLPPIRNHHVFRDNYFNSFWLLMYLGEHDVKLTRKILIGTQLWEIKLWKKSERSCGLTEIYLFRCFWYCLWHYCSNQVVYIAFNSLPSQPTRLFRRCNKIDRKNIHVLSKISSIFTIRVWVISTNWVKKLPNIP